ncbi:alpha/beta-Hydrolase [Glarea lozoyensis ATCC 20868]|uniref:Alpha/beta-Hydrolase n=1 Tax=Glarea lozoyensis (strain ATCC 20868 / MF5171) TaxID=1116229 RepID=S3CJL9_GLAL2|nr:alpha/beta-Hydrolase [Glarea lozoyensis ATCC 20868]EPE25419.1 alpha/beta-Hydrolase [Glarea lozoyensis ATCC 20868]
MAPHVITPQRDAHTHTIILLHGRDSIASEFASEFFESQASDDRTLLEIFPTTRWVFPVANMINSARFETPMSQWFDLWSVENPQEKNEIQIDGLRESAREILEVIQTESALVSPDRIILGGISQGCATAIHALLHGGIRLGGFIGLNSWLPFEPDTTTTSGDTKAWTMVGDKLQYSQKLLDIPLGSHQHSSAALETPVFLSHSQDDEVVPIANGMRLSNTLESIGMKVEWREYVDGGHWVNEPQGVDDIVAFINSTR